MTPVETQALDLLETNLRVDEGNVPSAYADSLGYLTIGIGFLIDRRKGGKLYPEEIDFILRNRTKKVLAGAQVEAWYPAVADNPVRLAGVLNMQYQLGSGSDEDFVNSFKLIAAKRWAEAGAALRKSKWYTQTPKRAERVIRMIESGKA
jgi:lysozyme